MSTAQTYDKEETHKEEMEIDNDRQRPLQCWIVNIMSPTKPVYRGWNGNNQLVITVTSHKLNCPFSKTYPINAVPIKKKYILIPEKSIIRIVKQMLSIRYSSSKMLKYKK